MRILLVTEFFPQDDELKFTGGVEARTYYLARELKKNHQVKVSSRSATAVPATPGSLLMRLWFMVTAIIKGIFTPADIVEGSNFVTYLPAFIIAKIKQVPAIAWYPDVLLGLWHKNFGAVGIIGEIMEQLALKLPWNGIIALSHQTKTKLIGAGVPSEKIKVVYAGIDKQAISAIKAKKSAAPTICTISRLVSYKRIGDLITAFAIVRQRLNRAKLIIIGTGPQRAQLKSLAQKLKVGQGITWQSNLPRQELLVTLKSAHVFCLPSVIEGFGLVTLEAMAAGIPYVNADIDTNREITHHGLGGLLFTRQAPQNLAKKLLSLLTDKKLYDQKVDEGKQLLKNYSWQKSASQTINVYESALL